MKFEPRPDGHIASVVYETGYGYNERWDAQFDNEGNLTLKDRDGNIITELSELEGRHIRFLTLTAYHHLITPE